MRTTLVRNAWKKGHETGLCAAYFCDYSSLFRLIMFLVSWTLSFEGPVLRLDLFLVLVRRCLAVNKELHSETPGAVWFQSQLAGGFLFCGFLLGLEVGVSAAWGGRLPKQVFFCFLSVGTCI